MSGAEDSRLARIGSLAASREAAILAILRDSGEVDMIALNRAARTAGIGYGRISDAETVRAIVGGLIDLGLVSRHRKAGTGQTRFWYSLTAEGAAEAARSSAA